MKQKKIILTSLAVTLALFILIVDTKTAVQGAKEGVIQCINVIIPSLLPFFLVSGLFCQTVQQLNLSLLSPVRKLCKIPKGAEPIFIIGLLGGYPIGANEIATAYERGTLSRKNAERMLGFCNNAGPSFIFGMIALQFTSKWVGLYLFLIQILSAVITGAILPGGSEEEMKHKIHTQNLLSVFQGSLRSIASVCGWVVLFRVVLSFLDRWFLWLVPSNIAIITTGFIELANGSTQLYLIENDGLRLIIASAILSFGGICVLLQTVSVTKGLCLGIYFPGKVFTCCISIVLSYILQLFLFETPTAISPIYLSLPIGITILTYIVSFSPFSKKSVAIPSQLVYNQ